MWEDKVKHFQCILLESKTFQDEKAGLLTNWVVSRVSYHNKRISCFCGRTFRFVLVTYFVLQNSISSVNYPVIFQ